MNHYKTQKEIEAVVSGFEECMTAKDGFKHASHLTVAVYYLRQLDKEAAVARMRAGLFRFLDHHGIDRAKYDEELTRKWFDLVESLMQTKPDDSLVAITNDVIERLGNSQTITRKTPPPDQSDSSQST